MTSEYTDQVRLVGEIRLASIDGNRFAVLPDGGTIVQGHFKPEQEATITEALREHATCRVELIGSGTFGADGALNSEPGIR
jgi:hypothetical protein